MKNELYDFDKDRRQDTNIGLITIAILIATVFLVFGLFIGLGISNNKSYDQGYKKGYHDAKLLYECDHDYAEHEVLPENY